ncbi:MAG: hypothetical protein JWP60_4301 [Ramlibacter sp.]|nr:hypothetical protein [Ramlibacter sp.]
MKVRCLRKGFDGLALREPGDIFELPDSTPPWDGRTEPTAQERFDGAAPGPWWEKIEERTSAQGGKKRSPTP